MSEVGTTVYRLRSKAFEDDVHAVWLQDTGIDQGGLDGREKIGAGAALYAMGRKVPAVALCPPGTTGRNPPQ